MHDGGEEEKAWNWLCIHGVVSGIRWIGRKISAPVCNILCFYMA